MATNTWLNIAKLLLILRRTRTNLEDMERFKLYIFTLVSQHIHHQLEVGLLSNVASHNIEICSIEEDLAQELE